MVMENADLTARLTIADNITTEVPLVSKDNQYLLCCCGCNIKVYSILTGRIVHILKGHSDVVTHLAFNPSNQFQVISCSADGTLRKWNFEDGVFISVSTPVCADDGCSSAVHRIIPLPGDKSNFLYLLGASERSTYKAGGYRLVKQSIMMERWSSADLVMKQIDQLPSHLSVGGQGSFLALLSSSVMFSVMKLSGRGRVYSHQVYYDESQVEVQQCLASLTCLAAHPTEDCVAVGHADGKINIWSNVLSKKALYSWVHWHALPVLSLSYTPEGSFLLSGGHESVLVKWPHGSYGNKSQREFLPRLGAPVSRITTSPDNSFYITSHLDNSVKVIRNWIVVQVFQGLTRDYLSADDCVYPAGVTFEPQTGALVVNGLPGHLQFYSLEQDSLLYNLDIVAQNYLSGESLTEQGNYTRIELVRFSPTGDWMVTVERWTGPYSQQCRMKFWYLGPDSKSYTLNTDVDTPHQNGAVSCIAFAPLGGDSNTDLPMLISVGEDDSSFKLWTLNEISTGKGCWRVDSTGCYKGRPCSVASFSDDGSLLAVAFDDTLTLWDPFESYLCTALDQGAKVTALQFCHGTEANYIAVTTSSDIIVWDLLDYSEKRRWAIPNCNVLAVDPSGTTIAAFSNKTGFLFNCNGKLQEFALPGYAQHVASAAFTTAKQPCPLTDLNSVKDRLYLSTTKGAILVVSDRDVSLHSDVTPTVEQAGQTLIATNYQRVTPLTSLLTAHLVKKEQSMQAVDTRIGLAAAQIVKQIGETSCIAMPSMNTLCRAFLSALLVDKAVKPPRDGDLSDSEMDVDEDELEGRQESDSDSELRKQRKQGKPVVEQHAQTTKANKRRLKKSDIVVL